MQELVVFSAKAISDRIVSGSCTLVWVAEFDDAPLRLFVKISNRRPLFGEAPVAGRLSPAKIERMQQALTG